MTFRRIPIVLLALACAATFGACGSSGSSGSGSSLPSGHADVGVIEHWADTLRRGDTEAAARYFSLPTVVQNGTAPVVLHSHHDVVAFNESLPCGARLVKASPQGRFIAATFRLTDRPGGGCGSGVGLLARTAFVIREGKIVQWRRLPNAASAPSVPTGPVV